MIYYKTLRQGDVGPDVELLQTGLTRAGFPLNTDGIFGRNTLRAVRSFQASHGLATDGIAGPATWRTLSPYLLGYIVHTVRSGDTIYRLSVNYNTSVRGIETANPKIDPLNLSIGQKITVPLGFDVVPTNIKFTSKVLELCADGLTARYPFIGSGFMGASVMGKPLRYFSIGSGTNQVFFNGAHHANEWLTSTLLMKYLEQYAKAFAADGEIGSKRARILFDTSTLFIAPMVDPDGVDLVTKSLISGRYYDNAVKMAESFPTIPFPDGWKANIDGIDLNLQYPASWEEAKRIKYGQGFTRPGPRDFVGYAPLSAPESRAVYSFTLAHDFSITLSYHSQGEVIFWKYKDYEPQNSYAIAQRFGELSGYSVELVPVESGNAGYKDWFIQEYNRPGYTIEIGRGASPLPLSQFDKIYSDNVGMLTYALIATV